jgi:peroxiredoxin
MVAVSLGLRLFLSIVFGAAAVAKLKNQNGTRTALSGFGLPDSMLRPVAVVLPLAELAVSVTLLVAPSAFWGATAAFGLVVVFSAAVAVNLARGNRPDCHCFGQTESKPIGPHTLVRNGLFAVCAGMLMFIGWNGGDPGVVSGLAGIVDSSSSTAGVLGALALAACAFQSWLCWHLLRQNGALLLRLDHLEHNLKSSGLLVKNESFELAGLSAGSMAPDFNLIALAGGTIGLADLTASKKPILLFFSDPNCSPCTALLPDIAKWQRDHSDKATFAVISRGTLAENRAKVGEYHIKHVLLQEDREIAEQYGASATPSAVLIDSTGLVAAPLALGAKAIAQFVSDVINETLEERALARAKVPTPALVAPGTLERERHIGKLAPSFSLPNLEGELIHSADIAGQPTLLLFWNPACGFCTRMLPQVREFEQSRSALSPRLVVISTGTPDSNRAAGFTSTVLLDGEFSVGRAFGVSGTPSAVLLDSETNVASTVAVGAQKILALASAMQSEVRQLAAKANS